MGFFYAINVLLCTLASVRIVNCEYPQAMRDPPASSKSTEFSDACNYRGYKPAGDYAGETAIVLRVARSEQSATLLEQVKEKFSYVGKVVELAVNIAGAFQPAVAVFKAVFDTFFTSEGVDEIAVIEGLMAQLAKDTTRAINVVARTSELGDIDNRVHIARQNLMENGLTFVQLHSRAVVRSEVDNFDIFLTVPLFLDLFRVSSSAANDKYLIFIDKVEGWITNPGTGPTVYELIELEEHFNLLPKYVEILFLVGFQTEWIHCAIRKHANCDLYKILRKNRIRKVIKYARNVISLISRAHSGNCAETFDVTKCTIKTTEHSLLNLVEDSDIITWEGNCVCQLDKYIAVDPCAVDFIIKFKKSHGRARVQDRHMMSAMARRMQHQQGEYLRSSLRFINDYWIVTVKELETSWMDTAGISSEDDLARIDVVPSTRSDVPAADISDADKKKAQEILEKVEKRVKDIVNSNKKVDRQIEKNLESILKKTAKKTN